MNTEEILNEITKIERDLNRLKQLVKDGNENGPTIMEAFNAVSVEGDKGSLKKKTMLLLLRKGYKFLNELEGVDVYHLLAMREIGITAASMIVVVLEHYGVKVKVPEDKSFPVYRRVQEKGLSGRKLKEILPKKIEEMRSRMHFRD